MTFAIMADLTVCASCAHLFYHGCYKTAITVGENIIATTKTRNNFWYPLKNGNFSNIAISILDFSLLPPI